MSSTLYAALVVDDSADYRRILTRILEPAGFKVLEAKSAEEGWAALQARVPDVAVVDWNLPGASGIDFARRVRGDERFRRMILLMLTVNAAPDQQAQGLRDGGFNAYMTKPFSGPELVARIEGLLRRKQGSSPA